MKKPITPVRGAGPGAERRRARRIAREPALWLALLMLTGAAACQDVICLMDPDEEHLCEEPDDVIGQALEAIGPVATTTGVAYRVPAADRITLLKTAGGSAEVIHVEVPESPSLLQATPDKRRLLSLSPQAQALVAFTVQDPSDRQTFALGSSFTALSVSEDGQYAIAFAAGAGDGSAVVQNNNEMAIINLNEAPGVGNPQLIALRSFGSRPFAVTFAPPFTIRGEVRRMALILSENYVTLLEIDGFDPENPNANETVVHFVQNDDGRKLRPEQIIWTEDDPTVDDDVFAFLRTNADDDLIGLNLLPGEELDSFDRPRVRPSLNQLTGGKSPAAIALFETRAGAKKLLSVNRGSRDLAIIDVATSDTTLVPLEEPVDQVLVYQAINRDTDQQESFALLYSANQVLRTVLFVELETVEVRRTRAIERLNLDRGITSLGLTPDPNRALIIHAGNSAFSILNLERRFVTPLDLTASISAVAFADDEHLLTVLNGQPFVSLIELSNGHPTSVRLDLPAQRMAVVPGTDTIVIDHGQPIGAVTLMPLSDMSRDAAQTLWGFGADDLFSVRD